VSVGYLTDWIICAYNVHLFFAWHLKQRNCTCDYSNIYPTRCNFTQFILSGNCSTCLEQYLHPSSGAQTTVSTASGISHTVTVICRYRGRVETGLSVLWVACKVASHWICIRIIITMHGPMKVKCTCDVWAYVTQEFSCLKCKVRVFCFIFLCILLVCKMPLLLVVYVCIKHIVFLSCKLRAVYVGWHIQIVFFLQIKILLWHSFFTGLFKLNKKESQDIISLRELLDLLNSRDHQKVIHSNGYGK